MEIGLEAPTSHDPNEARGPNVDIETFYVLSSPQTDPNDYFWSAMLNHRGLLIVKKETASQNILSIQT